MRQNSVDNVASALAEALDHGLPQEVEVLEYAATMHGGDGAQALAVALRDRESSDSAPLWELALFPGEELRMRLEPVLEQARLDDVEVEAVVDALARTPRRTRLLLPEGSSLSVHLEPEDLRVLVHRLRPDRTPPEPLADLVTERFSPHLAIRLKVRLRHCRLEWRPPRPSFLAAVLARAAADDPELALELLDWCLAFLDLLSPGAPPAAALGRRHRELQALLRRAELLQETLDKGNFETLIMQGMRIPHLHADTLRRELQLLDFAAMAVTGRPAAMLDEIADRDLGTLKSPHDLLSALDGSRE